jgi:hypothetical protein
MVKSLSKSIIFILLLTVMAGQITPAEARTYQSNNSMPFIRMMLSMMDAMGMLDGYSSNPMYGSYGSPWSSNSNPYMRAMALRGFYPGTSSSLYNNAYSSNLYGNNPFLRSPWLQSPWLGSGQYGSPYASPLWGSPDWGVLPAQKHIPYGDPYYGHSHLSNDLLEGWVDEPWEESEWNTDAETSTESIRGQASPQVQRQAEAWQQPAQTTVPLVQNFNIIAPDDAQRQSGQLKRGQLKRGNDLDHDSGYSDGQGNRPGSRVSDRSPLLKLLPSAPPAQQSARQPGQQTKRPPTASQRKPSPLSKKTMQSSSTQQQWRQPQATQQPRNKPREKACVTEFCGLKKPNMNGLWVTQDGEMLGIKGEKFLWADSSERYLAGYLKIENEYLVASVEGSERLMRFKYKLAGDHLLTMQPDGVIREFIRTSPGELTGGYFSGY